MTWLPAWVWPPWLNWLSWLWTNPASYNLWSSEWGGSLFKLLYLVLVFVVVRRVVQPWTRRVHAHLECHVDGCERWGYPVHGTGYRACHEHHPAIAHEPGEAITAAHIKRAHAMARRRI